MDWEFRLAITWFAHTDSTAGRPRAVGAIGVVGGGLRPLSRATVFRRVFDQGGGCQLDYQGNVYVGTNLVPVDGYGRLAIPNAITFRLRLMDNAGNEILAFGKYGNMDAIAQSLRAALLKARPLPISEATFGWPESVAASDRALYVADLYNHCIVRLDKAYALDVTEAVK